MLIRCCIAQHLIWVYTVCKCLYVPILRVITVILFFQRLDLGRILMAIDNITEQCYKKRMDISTEKMSLDEKLHRIRVGL